MFDKKKGLVTVIGGGGFIGRYVCECLLKTGIRVRVAERHPGAPISCSPWGRLVSST
jgi:NADH dehydrogenase